MKNLINMPGLDQEKVNLIKEFEKEIRSLPSEQQVMVNKFIDEELFSYLKFLLDFNEKIKSHNDIKDDFSDKLIKASNNAIQKGENLTKKLNNKLFEKRIRHFFRTIVSPWPYKSIMVDKGFKKHRGYPGDYEMMDYVYNEKICSNNIFGQYFDTLFLKSGYSKAVRGRKNFMRNILLEEIGKNNDLRILNIPCGPSRDVQEFLEKNQSNNDFKIACVDNDEESIEFSRKSIFGLRKSDNIEFKQGNILNYSKNPINAQKGLGAFDIVYSIGIADYFPDKLLQKFIHFTYEIIKPGGKLIFAFKITSKDPFAPLHPKWFCDWVFVSRNQEDVYRILDETGIKKENFLSEIFEESGRINFITIRKA